MNDSDHPHKAIFTFLSNLSHDLRTPLTAMLNMISVIKEAPSRHCTAENLELIQEAGVELKLLLQDIIDLAKIESGTLVLKAQSVDLRDLLQRVTGAYTAEAGYKHLAVRVETASAVPDRIVVDPERTRQVVAHLVSNAIKYTEKGFVAVRATWQPQSDEDAGRLLIAVEDSGVGIPERLHNHLFDSFFKTTGSRLEKEISGTGLGLAISKRLVTAMGGHLQVRSTMGQGSTFYFELPCRADATADRTAEPPKREPRFDLSVLGPLRVLVVEDNFINLLSFSQMLEQQGFIVQGAANGKQALAYIRGQPFDFVLMDVKMPVMDGLEATRRIRNSQDSRVRATKIVALTAYAMPEDRKRVFDAGVDDMVTKPIELEELARVLTRVLKSR